MDTERLKKRIKENWLSGLLTYIIVVVGAFMGVYCARRLPIEQEKVHKKDTIYIKRSITDSLLLDISFQLKKIEEKLQPKKVYIQKRKSKPCDTIKIDASIHIDQK